MPRQYIFPSLSVSIHALHFIERCEYGWCDRVCCPLPQFLAHVSPRIRYGLPSGCYLPLGYRWLMSRWRSCSLLLCAVAVFLEARLQLTKGRPSRLPLVPFSFPKSTFVWDFGWIFHYQTPNPTTPVPLSARLTVAAAFSEQPIGLLR